MFYFAATEVQVSEPHLLVEREGHVVTVTFNRPKARNAWSLETMARMWDAWQMIDEDPEVRCAILTGAGGTFCAGADLKLMHSDQTDNPWHARFREDPELHEIPVVMVTVVDDEMRCGAALGANDYLTKPVDRKQLLEVVRRYVGTDA